ncbi:protein FAF-like, chloroplastic [Hordeum vulgare subsp. vulgare]|uniref:FAF domain-containing protein n=1 Tax=Hordeum vulgare subsp. vulgare TaxID=112509 RepID=A0A8I6XWD1_HORVV|nr:protein FAF-like, chloroplastic [Hordeum vulgare subsp. vulgare]
MAVVMARACGYDRAPAPAPATRPFDGGDRGRRRPIFHDHCCVVHDVVMPPPPPPPPPLFGLHSGRAGGSKADPGLCTEGLGSESSESSGDLDLGGIVPAADDGIQDCKGRQQEDDGQEEAPARKRAFPPPISVIGAAGKPWQYLRAQRGGGRLVLREVRIPSRELLRACRADGRLKLHFARPDPDPDPEQENNIV